eukprot:2859275-Amphidinium_carterae.1
MASLDDADAHSMTASFDAQNRLRVVRKSRKGTLPANGEELRTKYRIEAHTWLMIAGRFSNKPWLRQLTQMTFLRFADFILGEKVAL